MGAAGVGAVILDSEKFSIPAADPDGAYAQAVSRKNNLIFEAARSVFPGAAVVQYVVKSRTRATLHEWC